MMPLRGGRGILGTAGRAAGSVFKSGLGASGLASARISGLAGSGRAGASRRASVIGVSGWRGVATGASGREGCAGARIVIGAAAGAAGEGCATAAGMAGRRGAAGTGATGIDGVTADGRSTMGGGAATGAGRGVVGMKGNEGAEDERAPPTKRARTRSATSGSMELEWVFFSSTPNSGSSSITAREGTSNSRASSFMRIPVIAPTASTAVYRPLLNTFS